MTLNWHDLQFALRRCPRELLNLMKLPRWENEIFVGGGFLRSVVTGEPVNDIDIFVSKKDLAEAIAVELVCQRIYRKGHNDCDEAEFKKATGTIHTTDNALTLRCFHPTIQIIHRWTFDSGPAAASSFDFSCCAAMFWRDATGWCSYCSDRFYPDLAAKRLVYLNPDRNEDAGGSMLRVLKYYQKGYRIPLDSLADVITRLLRGVRWDDDRVWSGKKTLNESYVSKILCGLLREVDPAIDPSHVAHLPAEDSKNEGDNGNDN